VITSGIDHHHERFALITVAGYGVVAVIALFLAWRRVFHPALPYAYVTFDVGLICLSVLLITRMLDFAPHMAFAIPASAMIFVVLAHASMRFRPALVAYAGTLTIVLMAIGMALMPAPEAAAPFSQGLEDADLLQSLLHSRILPFVVVALATLALWATSCRTYDMLQTSIDYSRRLGTLSRFFSPRLAERLAREAGPELSSGRRQRCAIMFIDIRKFTELAREMGPERLSRLLAEFRSVVTDVIFEHGGMVDKFIGDAVLAVFGALQPAADDAERAIRCGVKVLAAVEAWSASQATQGKPQLSIGIGAHYGEVFVGAVGNERMLEFTVLGDAVNLAERLERLTRVAGGAFVISREILEAVGPARLATTWAPVSQSLIAGRLKGIEVFSLRTDAGMPDRSPDKGGRQVP
jgi:adenylate cyclase